TKNTSKVKVHEVKSVSNKRLSESHYRQDYDLEDDDCGDLAPVME
ncbi:6526_t:CDS:2, partial [Racocetra persica]